jgi:hypothetical protein
MSQTKVQLIKDGALAEDSIVHDGDTNTKIRFSGADTITAETAGSERVRVDSSGKVGIGLTSPASPLHLHESSSGSIEGLKVTNSTTGLGLTDGLSIGLQSDEDVFIHNYENTSMLFGTNDTTRLTIDNAGSVLIGATSYGGGGAVPKLYLSGTSGRTMKIHGGSATSSLQFSTTSSGEGEDEGLQIALSGTAAIISNREDDSIQMSAYQSNGSNPVLNVIKPNGPNNATTTAITFESGNQGRGAILTASSDGGSPSFASASDYRIKTNIRNYTDGYNNIKALPVKLFDMISDETKDIKGWIAHEVQAYIPEAVMGDKDAVDSNEKPILQQLSYGLFMPDVVNALQTVISKLETLENKVAALETA